MAGGPIHEIPMFQPQSIVDLDDSCRQYKAKFRQKLAKAWDVATRAT